MSRSRMPIPNRPHQVAASHRVQCLNTGAQPTARGHPLQNKEGIRGHFWFTETELRNGSALRPDKTGKGLLMMLRHLGRISEVGLGGD